MSLNERDLRDRKLDVLRSVRTMTEDDVRHRSRRARYSAGHVDGHTIPAYVDEEGVDPRRGTAMRHPTSCGSDWSPRPWRWIWSPSAHVRTRSPR
jgi:glucose-6-phosphate 1-dehydrogenase